MPVAHPDRMHNGALRRLRSVPPRQGAGPALFLVWLTPQGLIDVDVELERQRERRAKLSEAADKLAVLAAVRSAIMVCLDPCRGLTTRTRYRRPCGQPTRRSWRSSRARFAPISVCTSAMGLFRTLVFTALLFHVLY